MSDDENETVPREKGDTSYVRVYKMLLQTPRAMELRERIRATFAAAAIQKHTFRLDGTQCKIHFTVTDFGNRKDISFNEGQNPVQANEWEFRPSRCIQTDELTNIAKMYLGKPRTGPNRVEGAVPTFNVNTDVVFGEKTRKKGKKETETFSAWATTELEREFEPLKKETLNRLRAEADAILADPQMPRLKELAIQRLAMDDMVAVLKKWQHLSLELLEEAFHQAVVAGVMDS